MIKDKYSKFSFEELQILSVCLKIQADRIKVPPFKDKYATIYRRLLNDAINNFEEDKDA